MGKVDYRRLPPERRQHHVDLLMRTLQRFGLNEQGCAFVRDLLMASEMTMCARRIEIARLLLLGWSFERVRAHLGVGLNTIISVDRWLNAKLPEYRAVLCPCVREPPYSWHWIRKKYSSHFMLINVLLGDDVWEQRPL